MFQALRLTLFFLAAFSIAAPYALLAQDMTQKWEMRGAWIATVINLDWPSNAHLSVEAQRAELTAVFNGLEDRGINTVFFQVRSEADAMYASSLEPWSRYLTGLQGRAPDPIWDPLETAVELAHSRGMELHAWVNPFRAVRQTNAYPIDPGHVSVTNPEWILEVGTQKLLDPGIPDARAFVIDVIRDILVRYDVDGIHFDDYFYPYTPVIGAQDDATFAAYNVNGLPKGDWRRENINTFMRDVYAAVTSTDPEALFGVSPFGIWRNGVPAGTTGLDAYNVVFADPLAWFEDGSIDYLVPQLYWKFGGGQDYATLVDWWASQAQGSLNPRPIYVGHAVYKMDTSDSVNCCYEAAELPRQIRKARTTPGVNGSVHFRTADLLTQTNQGFTDSLTTDLYARPAFRAPLEHRDTFPPGAPENLAALSAGGSVLLTWDPSFFGAPARRFAVYRVIGEEPVDLRAVTNNPENLLAVSYEPRFSEPAPVGEGSAHYVVTALTFNNMEGPESNVASIATSTAKEDAVPEVRMTVDIYPNPARSHVRIVTSARYSSDVPRIDVHDVSGRRVITFTGTDVDWDLTSASGRRLSPGLYLITVQYGFEFHTQTIIVTP